jgi:hypothetical protein
MLRRQAGLKIVVTDPAFGDANVPAIRGSIVTLRSASEFAKTNGESPDDGYHVARISVLGV